MTKAAIKKTIEKFLQKQKYTRAVVNEKISFALLSSISQFFSNLICRFGWIIKFGPEFDPLALKLANNSGCMQQLVRTIINLISEKIHLFALNIEIIISRFAFNLKFGHPFGFSKHYYYFYIFISKHYTA